MAWDASLPADDEKIADLGTVIRANWAAIAGGTVALTSSRYAATTTPTAVASHGFVYSKDVSAKAELHYADEDSNEIQLTSGGLSLASKVLAKAATDLDITAATNKLITIKTGSATTHKLAIQSSAGTERLSITGAGTAVLTGTLTISSTLGVTGDTTLSSQITAKVGDRGDTAVVVNSFIPVAWAYVNAAGTALASKNVTVTGGTGHTRTFTWNGYTPSDANYVVIANTNARTTKCTVTKASGTFTIACNLISSGADANSQVLDVVVFDT